MGLGSKVGYYGTRMACAPSAGSISEQQEMIKASVLQRPPVVLGSESMLMLKVLLFLALMAIASAIVAGL